MWLSSYDEPDEEYIRISYACVSKNNGHYFSSWEYTKKNYGVFLKLCLQCIKICKTVD